MAPQPPQLDGDDRVFPEPPGWLPPVLRRWAYDLTYDELHAFVIGAGTTFGLLLVSAGSKLAAIMVFVIASIYGIQRRPERTDRGAYPVVRGEVWYWLAGAFVGSWPGLVGRYLVLQLGVF